MHRTWGQRVCGFHDSRIDALIDSNLSHDASRYDFHILKTSLEHVRNQFGDPGLCYFVLHHYLDRFSDILVRILSESYEIYLGGYGAIDFAFYQEVKNRIAFLLLYDPKNLLSLIVFGKEELLRTLYWEYSGRGNRRRRRRYEYLIQEAWENIRSTKAFLELKPVITEVLRRLMNSLDCIVYEMITDFRERIVKRILTALAIKKASRIYRGLDGSPNINAEDVAEFLSRVAALFGTNCALSANN